MEAMTDFRPRLHITAPTGRLNDPNGLFIEDGILHVYYQKDPAFPFGVKRTGWGHVSTPLGALAQPAETSAQSAQGSHGDDSAQSARITEWNGVWTHHPDALYPDAAYDANGCYSGGAVRDERGDVRLFYTGNLKKVDANGEVVRIATQNSVDVAEPNSALGGVYRRSTANPLIDGPAAGYTAHYRDPMITLDPDADKPGHKKYRMVIGAQRADETGAVVLYRSDDLEQWEFAGEVEFDLSEAVPGLSPDLIPGGYMWECPNLFSIRDQQSGERFEVLIICPQGLDKVVDEAGCTHYASSDQCGYIVGHLEDTTFHVVRGFSELDYGHQFYAPQVVALDEAEVPETYVLFGWMGLPAQDDTPSVDAEGWVHSLTVPRELTLYGLHLRQRLVVPENVCTGGQHHSAKVCYRRELLKQEEVTFEARDMSGSVVISANYVPNGQQVLSVTYGVDTRTIACGPGELEILLDGATCEIAAQNGEITFSIAAFPTPGVGWDTINC